MRLDGKRALVTGVGKGIGREIAKKLVQCGAETYGVSRTQSDLDSLKAEVPSINVINLDLTDWDKTNDEIAKIGPVDFLINNASFFKMASFLESKKEDIDMGMDTNYKAVFNVSQVVAKGMIAKGGGGGVIINMSSVMSSNCAQGACAYGSSKAAQDMLTKSMALELGPLQIRVNGINPTVVWTPSNLQIADTFNVTGFKERTPLGKFAEIEDVVNTVLFLLSDKSAMIHGQCIRVDGGLGVY